MTIAFADPAQPAPAAPAAPALSPELLAALTAMLQQRPAAAPVAATPAPAASWGALAGARAAAVAPPPPIGVAVPLRIELPDGSSVKPLLLFGPECASPEALRPLLEALAAAQVPLDAWRPKPDDNRGGYGGRRGRW